MSTIRTVPKTEEVCRLSWFCIRMDEGQAKCGKPSGKTTNIIIHAMEIQDTESTNMYTGSRVRFQWQNVVLDGHIEMAADERCHVEEYIKVKCNKANDQQQAKYKYLMNYQKGADMIMHAVVNEDELPQALANCGRAQILPQLLYVTAMFKLIDQEFQLLKETIYNKIFVEPEDNMPVDITPWLLVCYCGGKDDVTYSIVHIQDTVMRTQNMYPNVVAYLENDRCIYQCTIIRKSRDRKELEYALQQMQEFCSAAKFPLSGTTCLTESSQPQIKQEC